MDYSGIFPGIAHQFGPHFLKVSCPNILIKIVETGTAQTAYTCPLLCSLQLMGCSPVSWFIYLYHASRVASLVVLFFLHLYCLIKRLSAKD